MAMGVVRPAHGFCRTTTVRAPADYNPIDTGKCFDEGFPLFWRNACVGYNIHDPPSRRVSYEEAANAISIAFTRWTGASCPTEGTGRSRASIDVRDLGPAACEQIQYKSGVRNQNVVLFRDDVWTHGPQVLGLTTVVFNPQTGEIFGADMEINTHDMEPIAFRDPVAGQAYDFLSVVTHEAGHFLGIGHSDKEGATMHSSYDRGQTFQRDLSPDDINAICTVYRPDGARSVLDGKVTQAPGCDPTPRGGFTRQCEEAEVGACGGKATIGVSTASAPRPWGSWYGYAGWAALTGGVLLLLRRVRRRQID